MTKKLIILSLFLTVTFLTFAQQNGENINDTQELINRNNITVIDGRIAFKTFEDYEKVVNLPSDRQAIELIAFIKSLSGFKSIIQDTSAEKYKNYYLNDPFFGMLLNQDECLQIGNFIFRIDPEREKVYVLETKNSNEYKDIIVKNIKNRHILIFSTGENVLELLRKRYKMSNSPSPTINAWSMFCNQSGVNGAADGDNFILGNSTYRGTVDFNRYGIYFSLFARIYPSIGGNQFLFDFNGTLGYIHYQQKCGWGADYGILSTGTNQGAQQRYQSYQGSKNLTNYFFAFSVRLNSGANPVVSNRMVVIRQNW